MKTLEIGLRILVGGIFLYAGFLKVLDPGKFLIAVRSYELLHDPWTAWMALALPWLEIVAGICVIVGRFYRGALLVLGTAGIAFLIALSSAWARGLEIECGCFGEKGFSGSYLEYILRDLAILAILLFLWRRMPSESSLSKEEGFAGTLPSGSS